MFNKSKGRAVLQNQLKEKESNAFDCKIDQTKSAVEMLSYKIDNIGGDVSGIILNALRQLAIPVNSYAKKPIPINRTLNGEFVGFLTGSIIYDF